MTVFVDTFALIAWLNDRDDAHAAVTAYLEGYTGRLLTTEWVLMELADAMSAPSTRSVAVVFLNTIREDPSVEIVGYDRAVYEAGFDLFSSRPDKAWSLTDCISFAVMTQQQLTDALTADHHFEQAGFCAAFKRG